MHQNKKVFKFIYIFNYLKNISPTIALHYIYWIHVIQLSSYVMQPAFFIFSLSDHFNFSDFAIEHVCL